MLETKDVSNMFRTVSNAKLSRRRGSILIYSSPLCAVAAISSLCLGCIYAQQ